METWSLIEARSQTQGLEKLAHSATFCTANTQGDDESVLKKRIL